MSLEAYAYPFLFLALFFESFVLVTLLSKPARDVRTRRLATATPSVAVIVPCYNEARTIAATAESLLALDYPTEKLEIILVDDGSTDTTPEEMARFAHHQNIRIVHKENGGKHTALNVGVALTQAEFIGCLDADSFVDPTALREIISCFNDSSIAATTAAMSVYRPRNLIEHMQNAEYLFGITFRHAISSVNGLYVTPGPFSFYRRSIVTELGGFRNGHQTEDMEMALRIQRAGYRIENTPRARVYTKAPRTLSKLIKQRTRWTTGFLRNLLGEYRSLIGNRKKGALGLLVIPSALIAIFGGIFIFGITIFGMARQAAASAIIHSGVPLSYALMPHGSQDLLFSIPSNFYWVVGIVALLISLLFIIIGKRLSKTPGGLGLELASYTVMYGLVVPLWLIRSTADFVFRKRRQWR